MIRLRWTLAVLAAAMGVGVVPLWAGIGVELTGGPDNYRRSMLDADIDLSKAVNLGFAFSNAASSGTAEGANTFFASVDALVPRHEHFGVGLRLAVSPEAGGARSHGWEISGSYRGENRDLSYDLSLAFSGTAYSEYVAYNYYTKRRGWMNGGRWVDLFQSSFEPSASLTAFDLVTLRAGAGTFSYDNDLEAFSSRVTGRAGSAVSLDGVLAVIQGFPGSYVTAGIAVRPVGPLKLSYDWTRTSFLLDNLPEDSSLFGVTYSLRSSLDLTASCNLVSGQGAYLSLGGRWYW